MRFFILLAMIALVSACHTVPNKPKQTTGKQHVLLISIDGYRYDYTQIHQAKNLAKLAAQSAQVKRLSPAFPSVTFPNHVSLVTGLYPSNHGIVSNSFFNPQLNKRYSPGHEDSVTDGDFYQGVPLWSLAGQQGMKSAAFFWVGSEAEIAGHRPTYWLPYDGSISNDARINQVVDWFSLPESQRPQFTTLYFSEVDSAGHKFGPEAIETYQAVQNVDKAVGELYARLQQLPIDINIIITSDHGMAKVSHHPRIYTDKLLDQHLELQDKFKFYGGGAYSFIHAIGSNKEEDLNALEEAVKDVEGLAFYRKRDIPAHLNFNHHPAIRDGLFIVHDHYLISSTQRPGPIGMHGYDSEQVPEMNTLMYGAGPAFAQGAVVEQASVVDVYPMIAKILDLTISEPIDGQLSVLAPLLHD